MFQGIKIAPVFYAVSHGGSLQRPLLVNGKTAKWLKDQGVKVLSEKEYKKELNKHNAILRCNG